MHRLVEMMDETYSPELADNVEQASREYIPPALQDTRCGTLIKEEGAYVPRHRFYGSLPQKGSKDKGKKLLEFESKAEPLYTTVVNAFEPYKRAFKARDPKMALARADALLDAFFFMLALYRETLQGLQVRSDINQTQ